MGKLRPLCLLPPAARWPALPCPWDSHSTGLTQPDPDPGHRFLRPASLQPRSLSLSAPRCPGMLPTQRRSPPWCQTPPAPPNPRWPGSVAAVFALTSFVISRQAGGLPVPSSPLCTLTGAVSPGLTGRSKLAMVTDCACVGRRAGQGFSHSLAQGASSVLQDILPAPGTGLPTTRDPQRPSSSGPNGQEGPSQVHPVEGGIRGGQLGCPGDPFLATEPHVAAPMEPGPGPWGPATAKHKTTQCECTARGCPWLSCSLAPVLSLGSRPTPPLSPLCPCTSHLQFFSLWGTIPDHMGAGAVGRG